MTNNNTSHFKRIFSCLIFFGILFLSQTAYSRDIYVAAANTSGVEDGTLANPYNTIQEAADVAVAGDVVIIKTGTYREQVKMAANGVIYQPFPGDVVTIDGTELLTGWANLPGTSVYKAFMPWNAPDANQLFLDKKMIFEARWPNQTSSDLITPTDAIAESSTASGNNFILKCNAFNEPNGRWVGATIWVNLSRFGIDGQGWTGTVVATNLAAKTITVDFREPPRMGDQPWSTGEGTAFYLFNPTKAAVNATGGIASLLDPGEWWKDGDTMYVRTPNSGLPAENQTGINIIEAKKRKFAFQSSDPTANRSGYTIRKLNLFACSICTDDLYYTRGNTIVEDAHDIVIDGINAKYISHFTDHTGDWQEQYYANTGIVLSGRNNVLKNSILDISAGPCVSMLGYGSKLLNNVIRSGNYSCSNAGAVNTAKICIDGEIAYNTISNTTVMGINYKYFKNSNPAIRGIARIHHNKVTNFMQRAGDSGGIDNVIDDGQWVRLDHNVLYCTRQREVYSPNSVFGFYFDFMAGRYIVDHNLVYNVDRAMIINSSAHMSIFNNTFLSGNPTETSILNGNGGTGLTDTIRNNILSNTANTTCCSWGNLQDAVFNNNALFVVNALAASTFVDTAAKQFQLKSSANNAIDKGLDYTPWNDPVTGSAVDLGAFEFGTPIWQAGTPVIPSPVISPNGGNFDDSIRITIASDITNPNFTIRYTTDGSEPNSSSPLYTGSILLTDSVVIKAKLFSSPSLSGEASAAVYVITPSPLIPLRNADNPSPVSQGVIANYYEWAPSLNYDTIPPGLSSFVPNRTDTTVGISLTTNTINGTPLAFRQDNFMFQFKGYIEVPVDGVYTFYTNSDDGSKLYIGDKLIVSNDRLQPPTEKEGIIGLKAGKHAIRVEFLEAGGGQVLQAYYKGPGNLTKRLIPATALWYVSGSTVLFNPAAGSYPVNVNVSLSSNTTGVSIRYTTDGSDPTNTSPLYSSPINITTNTVIKARTYTGNVAGTTVSAAYTITGPSTSINPNGGNFTDSTTITLTANPAAGSMIYYTLDGSVPTASSLLYTGPFKIYTSKQVKAIAINGSLNGTVVNASFSAAGPDVLFNPNGGNFTDKVSVVLSSPTASGVSIYYTTDGSQPTAASTLYSAPIVLNASVNINAVAIKDNILGVVKAANFIITKPIVAISPIAGVYNDSVTVRLTSVATGATIYYTTDGSTPTTTSSVYTQPFLIQTNTLIKAYAVTVGGLSGEIVSAAYEINKLGDGAVIFPNPAPRGKFSVRLNKPGNGQVIQMNIFDGGGKKVFSNNIFVTSGGAPQLQSYNLPFLKPSTYLVTLQTISYHADKFFAQIPLVIKY